MTDLDNGWQEIDTAPMAERVLLAYGKNATRITIGIREGYWLTDAENIITPFYWQPLPKSPSFLERKQC